MCLWGCTLLCLRADKPPQRLVRTPHAQGPDPLKRPYPGIRAALSSPAHALVARRLALRRLQVWSATDVILFQHCGTHVSTAASAPSAVKNHKRGRGRRSRQRQSAPTTGGVGSVSGSAALARSAGSAYRPRIKAVQAEAACVQAARSHTGALTRRPQPGRGRGACQGSRR